MKVTAKTKIRTIPHKSDMGKGYGKAIYKLAVGDDELGVSEVVTSGGRDDDVNYEYKVDETGNVFPSIIDALEDAGHEVELESADGD